MWPLRLTLLLALYLPFTLGDSDNQFRFTAAARVSDLADIAPEEFSTLSHPYVPSYSARIKRSHFCDGTVNAYTGYIDVGPRHLFFYFFESRNNPDTDDVLLWTNGGPGGSSCLGVLAELGPCRIISPNETKFNPHSWTSVANIFFIDQPVGTGFSYADYGGETSTSEQGGKDIAAFLVIFFETFTKFKGRGLHLAGESYAGRYLPVFASEIYDRNAELIAAGLMPINLKSIMLGNGATDFFRLMPTYHEIQCTNASGKPVQSISTCVRMKQALPRCNKWAHEACVEHFDLMSCSAAWNFCAAELMDPFRALGYNLYDITMKCDTETTCYPEMAWIQAYLNEPAVRTALGIDASFGRFDAVSDAVFDAFWAAGDHLRDTPAHVAALLARRVRVLVYAGADDFVANWRGNAAWTRALVWAGGAAFAAQPLRAWCVRGAPAGATRAHGDLTFATLFGAGHLVPHDRPVESLAMVTRWLANEDL